MPAAADEVCEVIITAPDPDWLVEFTRARPAVRLRARTSSPLAPSTAGKARSTTPPRAGLPCAPGAASSRRSSTAPSASTPDDDDMAIPPTTPIGTSKRRRYVPAAPVKHATAIQTPTSSALPGAVPEACDSAAASAGTPHGWRSGACMSWPTRPPSAQAAATSTCRRSAHGDDVPTNAQSAAPATSAPPPLTAGSGATTIAGDTALGR
jgi:hypothetical protein